MARRSTAELGLGFALGAEAQSEGERGSEGRGERDSFWSLSTRGAARRGRKREGRRERPRGSLQPERLGMTETILLGAPWKVLWFSQVGPFLFCFCFLFISFQYLI